MLPAILADVAPLSPEFQLGLISLLGAAVLVLAIMAFFKRKPTLDAELVKLQSSIETLEGSMTTLTEAMGRHAGHDTEIKTLKDKVSILESRREIDLHAQRTYTRETTREIFERLDRVAQSFGQNVQQFERAMGTVEGELKSVTARLSNLENRS